MTRASIAALVLLASCDAGVRIGTPCTFNHECTAPQVCGFGRCRVECVENRDCPLEALCLIAEDGARTCSLPDDRGCSAAAPCASGLICVESACVNACTTIAECPPDSTCEPTGDGRARCARADPTRDAGVRDAGDPPDAGTCPGPDCGGVVQIAAGSSVACARTQAGEIWCWGAASIASLEASEPCDFERCIPTPVRIEWQDEVAAVAPITGATDLCAGDRHACAILPDSRVTCWGTGVTDTAPLGQGKVEPLVGRGGLVRAETDGALITGITRLACNGEHTLARAADGTWLGWGINFFEQLGPGRDAFLARTVAPAGTAEHVTAGTEHVCSLAGGAVDCWGSNRLGQLGAGLDPVETPLSGTAVRVAGLGAVEQLVAGRHWVCALEGGEARCWGGREGLGLSPLATIDCGGATEYCSITPQTAARPADATWVELAGGSRADDVCARSATGEVWCWGTNERGVVVGPGGAQVFEPYRRMRLPPAQAISIGSAYACALVASEVWCWGENDAGQLGRGDASLTHDPDPAPVVWAR